MGLINLCNKIIEYSFYALFLLVPLFFTNVTSELFELNKMWITWALTIIIAVSWFTKMTITREIRIRRTAFDIPLLLFLLSQLISTVFSLDSRVSFWGYYSRFNGGFLSLFSYVFLYYAFVSNLEKRHALRILSLSVITGLIVVLWGLPSHFGNDMTCLMFRGTYDISCWTEAFKPTVRAFSTLGQPAWLAAYLGILLPITIALTLTIIPLPQLSSRIKLIMGILALLFCLVLFTATTGLALLYLLSIAIAAGTIGFIFYKQREPDGTSPVPLRFIFFLLITSLFYLMLLFSNTRAGFLGFWITNIAFWSILFIRKIMTRPATIRSALLFNGIFFIISFIFGTGFPQVDKFTLKGLPALIQKTPSNENTQQPVSPKQESTPTNINITDSGKIRLIVWEGAVNAWKAHPLFGTGVETFAFAYYKYRPPEHNLTSEWDYLYNKAHNEYLNYLTTTGIFGLGTYLLFIGFFIFRVSKDVLVPLFKKKHEERALSQKDGLLSLSLAAAFISILITNFFGFSVVIINLYFFFIPLLYLFIREEIHGRDALLNFAKGASSKKALEHISPYQWTGIALFFITGLYLLFLLLRFWQADTAYALGYNFNRVGDVQQAYLKLSEAVNIRSAEPVFKDEFATNLATLGTALIQNNQATTGAQLIQQGIALSNDVTTNHPNNIVYWKSRVRIFYLLSQFDPAYSKEALKAIEKAHELAPTDAKVSYNLGVIAGQNNQLEKGVKVLTDTIKMKPDYRDAYFARGLFYYQLGTDDKGTVIKKDLFDKAISDMRYILEHLDKNDQTVIKTLESWGTPVKK